MLVMVVAVLSVVAWLRPNTRERAAFAQTRGALRAQGFKTDLAEFDFSTSAEMERREAALTNAFFAWANPDRPNRNSYSQPPQDQVKMLENLTSNSAVVVWKSERLPGTEVPDLWADLRALLGAQKGTLDSACAAALAGPIQYHLEARHGMAMLLRHLAGIKTLEQAFGLHTVLALHDENHAAAWTNLLAATRLVTAWQVEPTDISHLVQFAATTIVFETTWQALQARDWSDEQLRQLQDEWESLDLFKGLPETAAFSRAGAVAACELQRKESATGGMKLMEMLRFPRATFDAFKYHWQQRDYRNHGVFEDEQNLLLYYRDREVEMRHAIRAASWMEMRTLPGVTNHIAFSSKHPSRVVSMLNLKHLTLTYQGFGQSFLSRAAEAETRRRILVTAIALERYRNRTGRYPATLADLVPTGLPKEPRDFMDGQPLRYRATEDAHFILYSVGLDGRDNGGNMAVDFSENPFETYSPRGRHAPGTDLVWPRPASAAEAQDLQAARALVQAARREHEQEMESRAQWERNACRQKFAAKILTNNASKKSADQIVNGRSLNQLLLNPETAGTNKLSFEEMLTVRQVITGLEPESVTFEVPMAYDSTTNLGGFHLFVDPVSEDDCIGDWNAGWLECERATNGNCRLIWNTIYETPGQHAVQLGFLSEDDREIDLSGPLAAFEITNPCEFSLNSATFEPAFGATIRGQLVESNAQIVAEMLSPTGTTLRTIRTTTSNGIFKIHWDLQDESSQHCTNNSFGSVFRFTFPDSGRSQTMRGP